MKSNFKSTLLCSTAVQFCKVHTRDWMYGKNIIFQNWNKKNEGGTKLMHFDFLLLTTHHMHATFNWGNSKVFK